MTSHTLHHFLPHFPSLLQTSLGDHTIGAVSECFTLSCSAGSGSSEVSTFSSYLLLKLAAQEEVSGYAAPTAYSLCVSLARIQHFEQDGAPPHSFSSPHPSELAGPSYLYQQPWVCADFSSSLLL